MSSFFESYGLSVKSEIELVGCPTIEVTPTPDITIELDSSPITLNEDTQDVQFYYNVNKQSAVFFYNNVGNFFITNGNNIRVQPAPDVTFSLLAANIVGTSMGILHWQRGSFVMHGCAVEIEKEAVIFSGISRAGKSTIATSMIHSGYPLLTDDVVVVNLSSENGPIITPSFPSLKMSHDVARFFHIPESNLHALTPEAGKKRYDLSSNQFKDKQLPIRCIYLPSWGEKFSITPLTQQEAIIRLAPHVYGPSPRTKYPAETTKTFQQTVKLVESIPVFQLTRPYDLDQAKLLPAKIQKHIETL